MTDFNLSERIEENDEDTMEEFELSQNEIYWLYMKDVKEFIRLLNKLAEENGRQWGVNSVHIKEINKLAGDKLT